MFKPLFTKIKGNNCISVYKLSDNTFTFAKLPPLSIPQRGVYAGCFHFASYLLPVNQTAEFEYANIHDTLGKDLPGLLGHKEFVSTEQV